jgi:hypothetical protein
LCSPWSAAACTETAQRRAARSPVLGRRQVPWWCFDPFFASYGVGGGKGSSPQPWLDMGCGRARNRRRGVVARALSLRLKFEGLRPLFMGLLVPDRSREKVLAILSLTELNPALVGQKSRRGRIPFGYDFVSSSGATAGDDAVRVGPARPLHHTRRGERPGWVACLGWGQAALAGPR